MTPSKSDSNQSRPENASSESLTFERVNLDADRSDVVRITDEETQRSSYIEVAPGLPGWGNAP